MPQQLPRDEIERDAVLGLCGNNASGEKRGKKEIRKEKVLPLQKKF